MKSLLLTAAATLGLAAATMAQTVPGYVPTNGLVGWWPFNGNANDESGNGNNGTVSGATLVSDRFSNPLSAYNFNYTHWSWGSGGDEIYIPYASSLAPTYITVSVWVYRTSAGYSNQGFTIIDRFEQGYNNPNGQTWIIDALAAPNTNIRSIVYQAAPNNSQSYLMNNNLSLALNTWTNIGFTFDGNSLKQFINGVLSDSLPANGLILNTAGTSGISIGVSDQANGHWSPFDGKIDDIGIWNRALTQQEITDLYNGCQLAVNTQPNSQTISINNNAQFIVGSSDPNATYQWQTDLGVGFQNLNSVGQYSGTTNDTLTVSNVTLSNNNQPFRCIVNSGSCSDTSSVAVLTVNNNVGISEIAQENLFSVFPNPAHSIINIKAHSTLIGSAYVIQDNVGSVILQGKINSENTTIELGNLSVGVYFFRVGENKQQMFRIIKHQ